MNIVVIGLGSMGKRRIRLIRELFPDYVIYGVDARIDRIEETEKKFLINCYSSISEISLKNACAFVCTTPLSHNSIITACLEKGWHVFTELNLICDGYDKNMAMAREKNLKLFLSSTFFYREEIKYIRSKISNEKKWNYIYHIGQYLPDWHPWENYKDFFLGDKRTNGCREILAIELPWIIETFGQVLNVNVLSSKMTDLNIDYNDNFMIQLTHENGNKGSLVIDVVSPLAVRKLEIYSEGSYLSWDGTPEKLFEYSNGLQNLAQVQLSEKTEHIEGYRSFVVENAYKNEINEFFDVVLSGKTSLYSFEKDKKILEMIDQIGA